MSDVPDGDGWRRAVARAGGTRQSETMTRSLQCRYPRPPREPDDTGPLPERCSVEGLSCSIDPSEVDLLGI